MRAGRAVATGTAAPLVPERPSLPKLRAAATHCKACDLWERGTQTVFGEGGAHAQVVFVGEQPGNDEDLAGRPFVGPAGKLLDRALEAAGIDRTQVYVTNVVKHFKWVPQGKRRIHQKPNSREIAACRPWLDAEIDVVGPSAIACLGVTAAAAALGRPVTLSRERGTPVAGPGLRPTVVTIHPSAVLGTRDDAARHAQLDGLVHDLGTAWEAARASS